MNSYAHQEESVQALLDNEAFAIFHETGMGKSKIVIDAACRLFLAGKINTVLVVAPSSVRSVWSEADIGEIAKHCTVPYDVCLYSTRSRWCDARPEALRFIVTSYEFLRMEGRALDLQKWIQGFKVMMILDESSFIKNRASQQFKTCKLIGDKVARRVILNGTPVMNSPVDLWAQFKFLDPMIFGRYFTNFYSFQYRYCVVGGWHGKQILQHVNLDDLTAKTARYLHRKTKADCLDLPDKIHTWRDVPLSKETWAKYVEMRKEMLVELDSDQFSMAINAITKALRLSQMCGGFLGGVQTAVDSVQPLQQVSSEKLDFLSNLMADAFSDRPKRKVIVWFRFTAELETAFDILTKRFPAFVVEQFRGGQTQVERENVLGRWRKPGPAILLASTHAGGFGLTLTEADYVVYVSNDYSYGARKQSEDRTHRIGQHHPVTYVDLRATGPSGQQTIDHHVLKALANKKGLADLTAEGWKAIMKEEPNGKVD